VIFCFSVDGIVWLLVFVVVGNGGGGGRGLYIEWKSTLHDKRGYGKIFNFRNTCRDRERMGWFHFSFNSFFFLNTVNVK